ncbi:MAG: hypothetical protein U9R07_11835 [Pseudomonadota bacterium]|nr:hypothetical protein [Pseudomonadota bacterium]
MGKTQQHPAQYGFVFETPTIASAPAELAGLERRICAAVSEMLKGDERPRELIAAAMSMVLDEEISKAMLDAYASPAREDHKVPLCRFMTLIAVTKRHDIFDRLLREIGAALLVGEEIQTARIGQIDAQIARLNDERKRLKATAPLIRGGEGQ